MSVCLTARQQKFYNYFVNYAKSNGMFPNPTQTSRDMKCNPGVAAAAYGTLLLKGCFTNGQPLTSTYKARHNTTPIQPLNIANFKMEVKPKEKPAKKPNMSKRQLATLLIQLLSQDKLDNKSIAQLLA